MRHWREWACLLAKQAKIPKLKRVFFVVELHMKGVLQDTGNCHGTTKAIIDGMVDAGVIPDDDPEYKKGIFYITPVRDKTNWIRVTVHDLDSPLDYSFLNEL